ncbi:MAG: hypothetical protein ACI4I0_05960 [Acutalibacteraceae bacterium]
MRNLVFAIVAIATFPIVADTATNTPPFDLKKKPATEEERLARKAYIEERFNKHTGGRIVVPGSLKGKFVYVNAQKRAPLKWLQDNADVFHKSSKFTIEVADGEFSFPSPKIQGEASLFVVDDENLPPLLSAPESRWAMVNVAPLAKGAGEKPQFFAARVQKELTRGFCLLAGAQNSGYPDALVGCITKAEQLDKFADCRLPVDVLARFAPYSSGYGITPAIETTYRKACKEGWAPQPTNDYQKAIWDSFHELPTKPVKIEFDPAKGK